MGIALMVALTHLIMEGRLWCRVTSQEGGLAGLTPLSAYGDEGIDSLVEVLIHRVTLEPLNLFATVIFLLAIVHTFCAPWLLRVAKRR